MNSRGRLSALATELWRFFYRIGLYGVTGLGVVSIMILVLLVLVEIAGAHVLGSAHSL